MARQTLEVALSNADKSGARWRAGRSFVKPLPVFELPRHYWLLALLAPIGLGCQPHAQSGPHKQGPYASLSAQSPALSYTAQVCPCRGQASHPKTLPLEEGAEYSITVKFDPDSHEWLPSPFPRMPHHYAARLEWAKLDAMESLDASRDYVFQGKALKNQISPVQGANTWRAVSTLEVHCVCPTPPGVGVPQRQENARLPQAFVHTPGSQPGTASPAPDDLAASAKAVQPFDPDGNDDPEPEGEGPFPKSGHFERVGRAPISLRQICDLTPLGDALYAAHALAPLGADGAAISRYLPANEKRPFTMAFDWNRPGEPAKGGGAGQGFLRVRAIDGRLYVPDADPPYNGFGLMDWGTEGYVFVSRSDGSFAYAMRPHFRPPQRPNIEGRAGAMVLPRAYHDFDVIRFRGHLIASTGAVPPKERAWVGPSPGALHVATADLSHFEYALSYPNPYVNGVWRLTYMIRYRHRLYAGIQDYDGRAPDDFVMLAPAANQSELRQEDLHPVRVTEPGAAQTLRWYADAGKLYWIAWGRDGTWLRVTSDGDHWSSIALPSAAGAPTDIVRYRGKLVVLAEHALLQLEGTKVSVIASVADKKSPFELRDGLCAPPLAVFRNELYAGGQRDGSLYRFIADA